MANTRTNLGDSGETLRTGDTDRDFDGTFPGSSPVPTPESDDAAVHTPISRRTHTTKDQWRNYAHTEIIPPVSPPPTPASRRAAQLALDLVRRPSNPTGLPQPGTLLDGGRAVLGSRAMSQQELTDYLSEHPGSSVVS